MPSLKLGIVGATGVVGETFLNLLQERDVPVSELRLFASEASAGKNINVFEKECPVQQLEDNCFEGLDLVFFSSGEQISQKWAPSAVEAGAIAIDNSSAFRMDPEIPLIVPEVNGSLLKNFKRPGVIANPNCSTIQLVVVLNELEKSFGLTSVQVSSYQAVSGGGRAAIEALWDQTADAMNGREIRSSGPFAQPIAFNCLPQIGSFDDSGFCTEELKIMRETKKILARPELSISAFTVRIPVLNGHAEAVWVELKTPVSSQSMAECLTKAPGIEFIDSNAPTSYPTPLNVSGNNPVYVGRAHCEPELPSRWLFWIVADNLRKGAALNGLQIAEHLFDFPHPS